MLQYIVKRLLLMIPTLAGIILVSFLVIKTAPGDPTAQKFGAVGKAGGGMDAARGTEDAIKAFRQRWKLDEPLHIQFQAFLERLYNLDLRYIQRDQSIGRDLKRSLKITIQLNLIVFFLIYLISVPLGIASAAWPRSGFDKITTVGLFMLYSIPSFWMAELLRMNFSDKNQAIWFPILGLHSDGYESMTGWERFTDYLHHIFLPIVCMTYGGLAYMSRQMRAGMLEVIHQDYIRTAEAKGVTKARVILVHALRNGLFPIITLFASLLPFLIGGSVIIETIFAIDGMGKWTIENIFDREYDVVMATLILSAILTLVGILISDILYVLVNPQVTFENRS
ncbi:MAG TPA: ABC transporter permease [Planctomycetaceae bacterium]|nr:ABC transporter permease [Planctomycetaceae bacterium]